MLKLQVIGNVGGDAVIREVGENKTINFSVAKNEKYKDGSGTTHEKTTWVSCTIWKKGNESTTIAQYLKAGTKVFLEGKPGIKTWQKEDKSFYCHELNVFHVELLGSKQDSKPVSNTPNDSNDDDLPF